MKNIFTFLLFIATIFACSNQEETIEITKESKFKVNFNIQKNGVSISEENMDSSTKTVASNADLYAIKISEKEGGKLIACGIFDQIFDFSTLSIDLQYGIEYIVEATMLKNGKNLSVRNRIFNDRPQCVNATDWIYSKRDIPSLTLTPTTDNNDMAEYERWYYKGEYTGSYNSDNKTITINLRRMSFAIKFVSENLQSGYSVQIKLASDATINGAIGAFYNDYTFNTESLNEKIYCIPNIEAAYPEIANGNAGVSSDNYKYKYKILDGSGNKVKESESYKTIGNCKANSRYTITLDCNVPPCSFYETNKVETYMFKKDGKVYLNTQNDMRIYFTVINADINKLQAEWVNSNDKYNNPFCLQENDNGEIRFIISIMPHGYVTFENAEQIKLYDSDNPSNCSYFWVFTDPNYPNPNV